jgi:hypothetical protein
MAAQLCPVDQDGEYVFAEHRIREFTSRATIFELRRYMTTLRARNAFLCGLDAFAEQHARSLCDSTICGLIRTCIGLKVISKNLRDHEWSENGFRVDYIPMRNEQYEEAKKAGRHWRGDCRDCGLSDTMTNNITSAELGLINSEIQAVVTKFRCTRAAYVGEMDAKSKWVRDNMDGAHVTAQKYEEVIDSMDVKLLTTYNRMREQLCTLVRLGLARIGMRFTSLDDFFLATFVAWGQGCNAAAKRAAASAPLAPRYLCMFGHIADQMRQDRLRFVALQGLRLNLDLPDSKRVKQLAQTYAATGAIGA